MPCPFLEKLQQRINPNPLPLQVQNPVMEFQAPMWSRQPIYSEFPRPRPLMEIPFNPLMAEHARILTMPPALATISIKGTSSYTVSLNLTPNCQRISVRVKYRQDKENS